MATVCFLVEGCLKQEGIGLKCLRGRNLIRRLVGIWNKMSEEVLKVGDTITTLKYILNVHGQARLRGI